MFLKVRRLKLEAKKPIVILNKYDSEEMNVKALDRIELTSKNKTLNAIINVAEKFVTPGSIGLYEEVLNDLKVGEGDTIRIRVSERPNSLEYIKKKLHDIPLKKGEIETIIDDVVCHKLSDIEVTTFVDSLHINGMSIDESSYLASSMAKHGGSIDFKNRTVFDKHSIGGISGDKTSILLVPIVAAAGLCIPKTSSRSITSPAGTADRAECIMPVTLSIDEIKKAVNKTNGCLVWGGAIDLAPADDIFIEIERPFSIDPLLLPSILSKKKSVGAKYAVIDMPTGRGAKMKTIGEANILAEKFVELGKRLDINISCVSTFGNQPVGYGIGPALEAREALETIQKGKGSADLIDKACELCSVLFKFRGMHKPKDQALRILKSKKAWKKFREIIEEQGGDPDIRPEDIPLGKESIKLRSDKSGMVLWVSNHDVKDLCRMLGTPRDKGAGILLHKKMGDKVRKGEILLELFAEKKFKLKNALKYLEKCNVIGVGKTFNMKLAELPEEKHKKVFILDR